ncbi:sensor domain-containing diguanylate cyclase [Spiribacter halobius]|nr:diguanylate cyclase [Spiribacter halobius]
MAGLQGLAAVRLAAEAGLVLGASILAVWLVALAVQRPELELRPVLLALAGAFLAAAAAGLADLGVLLGLGALRALGVQLAAGAAVLGLALIALREARRLRRLPAPAEFHQAQEALSRASAGQRIAQQALNLSEGRFRAAFEHAAIGMLLTDMRGRVLRHNAAFAALIGGDAAGIQRRDAVGLAHDDDQPALREALARLAADGQGAVTVECRLRHRDGRAVWVTTSLAALPGAGAETVVWQVQDIGERKAYEQTLRETRDALEQRVAERTRDLQEANRRLERANRHLRRMARDDALTGISNRRHLTSELRRARAAAARYGDGLAVLMVDIDHFKRINDNEGHQLGDQVLVSVADTLRRCLRASDTLGRYGGDELCAVLPHADAEAALAVAEKVRRTVHELAFRGRGPRPVCITCSVGVAVLVGDERVEALLARADDALYQAKRAGRDRVVLAADPAHDRQLAGQ